MKIRFIRLFVVALFTLALLSVGTPARAQRGWRPKKVMPETTYAFAVGAVDGKVYVVGGISYAGGYPTSTMLATVWAYDPITDSWAEKASMPTPRAYLSVATVHGMLYAAGGCSGFDCGSTGGPLTTVEAYDPWTDKWTEKAPMRNPRRDFVLASADGILYAMGGDQGPGCSGTTLAEAYNPSTNVWTELAPLPTDQHGAAGGAIHGRIYVAGGFDCSLGRSVVTTRAYDPRTNSWSLRASMPPGLGYKSAVLDGKLYVASTPTGAVFDPEADSWRLAASLPEPVGAGGAAAVHGVLYVVGQVGSAPPYSDVMFAYSPGWPLGLF